jgi:hypothetical protein
MNRYDLARRKLAKKNRDRVMTMIRSAFSLEPTPAGENPKVLTTQFRTEHGMLNLVCSVGWVELANGERFIDEHVSFSYSDRIPTWEDVVLVRSLAWDDDLEIHQILPPLTGPCAEPWINLHPNTLHLHRRRSDG